MTDTLLATLAIIDSYLWGFWTMAFLAGVADVDRMWLLANIAVTVTAIPNLLAMLSMSGVFTKLMRDELSGERSYATAVVDGAGPVMRGYGATADQ